MALRTAFCLQFFKCCARRKLPDRPLTRFFNLQHQRTLWNCCKVPRHPHCCFKCSLRDGSVCRSFSLGGSRADNETDIGPETQLNPPDTSDTTNQKHNSLDHNTSNTGREVDKTGKRPLDSQSNDSNADGDETAAKPGTLNLSDLTWSDDDGIVVYPDVHFGTGKEPDTKDRPKLKTWKDEQAARMKTKDHDIRSLLYNIQESRLKRKEEVVVRERRSTVMSAEEMVEFLREQNARDIVVIELPPEVDYVKYFIVCSGMGTRHIGRMADSLAAEVRMSGQ